MTKIKICGITSEEEASWLAGEGVSYAGFVFYEKSKRRVAIDDAARIAKSLGGGIKKVAVAVSPDAEMVGRIEEAGFDILQVHGPFDWDAMRGRKIPVWRAANISGMDGLSGAIGELPPCVCGVLLDAGDFGSGKTFGWDAGGAAESARAALQGASASVQGEADSARGGDASAKGGATSSFWPAYRALRERLRERGASLILAGGLSCENVAEAIRIFSPDAVDVSSGVERRQAIPQRGNPQGGNPKGGIPQCGIGAAPGKDRELIRRFCSEVKNAALAADRSAEKPM